MKKYIILMAMAVLFLAACSSDDTIPSDTKNISNQDDDDTTSPINDNYTYKLPVIFHVLYTNETDSVRNLASRLPMILGYVNEIYQGNLYGYNNTYGENINVDFQPALTDEDGNRLSTPGVVFEKWDGSFPIESSSFMASRNNKKYIWEPNEYINVIVYPFQQNTKGSIILGISHMPYSLNDSTALDGLETTSARYMTKNNLGFPYCVSINSDYLYYMSSRYQDVDSLGRRTYGKPSYLYNSCDIVATLAHELGHYLGLHHVFTEEKKESGGSSSWTSVDDCFDSDFCEDTKSYNKVEYNEYIGKATTDTPIRELLQRNSCDGSKYVSINVMDYSIGYAFRFTPDQKKRMRHVLYYSPLIPGPKINHVNSSTRAAVPESGIIDLPIVTSE